MTRLDSVKKKCYAPPLPGNYFFAPEPAWRTYLPDVRVPTAASTECKSEEEEPSMPQFCTKCGTPLPEGMKFCTGCGASLDQTAAPAEPAPRAQPLAAPAAQAPVAAAPVASSGSPVLKIVLIVVAVLIFFGLVSAGACVYFLYRTKQRVSQFEKQVHATVTMPTGTGQAPTPPAAPADSGQETPPIIDMGVPVYPGATAAEGESEVSAAGGKVKVQEYTTSDSLDKVAAFYKEKMGAIAVVTQSEGSALVHVVGSNGVIDISIASDSSLGKTTFTITSILR